MPRAVSPFCQSRGRFHEVVSGRSGFGDIGCFIRLLHGADHHASRSFRPRQEKRSQNAGCDEPEDSGDSAHEGHRAGIIQLEAA
jgi:hypothetical protein